MTEQTSTRALPRTTRTNVEVITLEFPAAETYAHRDRGVDEIPGFTAELHVSVGNNWGVNNALELLETLYRYRVTSPEVLEVVLRATGHQIAPTEPQ